MKTQVYRVFCTAGMPINQTPESPRKMATVYFPDNFPKQPTSREATAILLAKRLLQQDVVNDPEFKGGCGWHAELTGVDLSEYLTPNLETPEGAKAWLN
jgi:hypothetical protein